MANVHRIQDLNDNQRGQYQNMQPGYQQQQHSNLPFLQQLQGDPKGENFGSMLVNSLCPRIKVLSFTFFVVLLISSLYIAMLSIGGINKGGESRTFLLIQSNTLQDFGGNSPYNVKFHGELYLWLSSIFLVQDFLQWITTCIYIMIFTSPLEAAIGIRTTALLYICGGACGALFGDLTSCCSQNIVFCEANSALYAMVGAYVAVNCHSFLYYKMVILYWQKLEVLGQMRMFLVCIIFMMILFLLLSAFGGNYLYTDSLGGLGGFLGGLFIGLSTIEVPLSGEYEKNAKYAGLGFLCLYVSLCIILLFTLQGST